MRNILLIITALFLTITSCSNEGLGNYDYIDINKISIEEFNQLYEVFYKGDPVIIEPVISQDKESTEDNLSFLWVAKIENTTFIDTLSYERNLNISIDLVPSDKPYILEYYAFDDNTEVFERAVTELKVNSELAHGLMILSDNAGTANLDYIRFDGLFFDNAYQFYNDEALGTNPIGISYFPSGNPSRYASRFTVVCGDSRGGVEADPTSFGKIRDYKKSFLFAPDDMSLVQKLDNRTNKDQREIGVDGSWSIGDYFFGNYDGTTVTVVDNKVYWGTFTEINQFSYPASKVEGSSGVIETFDLHKDWLMYGFSDALAFDKQNKRFLKVDGYNNEITEFAMQQEVAPWTYEAYPMDFEMVSAYYGGNGASWPDIAEMIIKNVDGNYEIAEFEITYNSLVIKDRKEIGNPGVSFDEDTPIAFSHYKSGIVFYANDNNELVRFNKENDNSEMLLDYSGNEITHLKLDAKMGADENVEEYWLYVSTYGGSAGTGSVYVYQVDTDTHDLTLLESYENITDKVVDLVYKRR